VTAGAALIRYLIRPARGGAGLVLLVFAPLLVIAKLGGLLGLPMALLLFSWFSKYAYILFDATVRGEAETPALDIQMLHPFNELRPLAQLAVVALAGGAIVVAGQFAGPVAAAAIAIGCAVLLPASVAVLGLEGNPLDAINPLAWLRLVRGLGFWYLAVLGVIAGYGLLLEALHEAQLWQILQLLAAEFATLSVFTVLAGALYERRHELGLDAWHAPERKAQRDRDEEERRHQRTIDAAHDQVRIGLHTNAWKLLQDWLGARGNAIEDYSWLCERLASWTDARYAARMTQEYLERLLSLRRNGEALDVLAARLRLDPEFRPKSAASTFALAALAARGGAKPVARRLLGDFAQRFAGDATVAAAGRLAQQLEP
jgi:hypothetical protein